MPPGDADLVDDGEDHVLAARERPEPAAQLDLDRRRHGLPEPAVREARRDVGRAEARAEGAERAVRAGVRVAAGDHRAREHPAVLDEDGVLDPAAALVVEHDALLVAPVLQPLLEAGRADVLGGDEVVGDDDDLRRVEDPLDAHPLERLDRHRAGDVVRQHEVAAEHHDVAGRDVVDVGVVEDDLLGGRVRPRGQTIR